jgi:organic hydroperoxide reductase OsmC/OhrA/mannose-6-phosphate isomerase-like protein (cupin superfamily)
MDLDVVLKRFESPDEVREMEKGKFEIVRLGETTIGRATYEPGWRWSLHVGPRVGETRCRVAHVGLVVSGTATAAFDDGRVFELKAGELFYIPPVPHDSWVVGSAPYVSLHFLGAHEYAASKTPERSERRHSYRVHVAWTGNTGQGTSGYRLYERAHEISVAGKPVIPGSSDPAFRGDRSRYNPEEFLVASLSTCHMLWFLHLCAEAKIVVTDYADDPVGTMIETDDGGGRFTDVVLRPAITLAAGSDAGAASQLHGRAHHLCFIASSVNFPVRCEPTLRIAETSATSASAHP